MKSSIAESTVTSTTVRAEHETEAELKFRQSANAPNDSENLRDSGRRAKRITAREIRLRWDPNIHLWFPVPCDDFMDMK